MTTMTQNAAAARATKTQLKVMAAITKENIRQREIDAIRNANIPGSSRYTDEYKASLEREGALYDRMNALTRSYDESNRLINHAVNCAFEGAS